MKHNKAFSKEDLIIFSRQLSLVIDSDISLYEGLSLIKEKSDNPHLGNIITLIMDDVAQGFSLSEAMSKHSKSFPTFIRTMIKVGEESGELSNVLTQIADAYEKDIETTAKVRSAVTYPIILATLMLGVIILLIVKVLPMFNDILQSLGGEMPAMTHFIMNIGLWLGHYLLPITGAIVLIVILLKFYFKSNKGKALYDKMAFKMPIQGGIISALTAVRFSRNLSLLIKSGVSTAIAMNLVAPVFDNNYVADKIKSAATEINEGKAPDEAIEKLNLFPWVLIKLFSVAQTTGHMDTILEKAATTMEKELDYQLDRLTSVIEPLLIIVLSCIVGIILISVILPIVGIMNAIG